MTYLESSILHLRTLINDLDESDYTYSDERLKKLFLISACTVLPQVSDEEYVIDMDLLTITEEPNKYLTNLIALKSACLLLKGEAKSNAGCSVRVIDGPSTIHLDGVYKSTKDMANSFCEQYEKEKAEYLLKTSQGFSSVTPIKNHSGCCSSPFHC